MNGSGIIGSLILAASSLINGHHQRKQAGELESDRRYHELKVIELQKRNEEESLRNKIHGELLIRHFEADLRHKIERGGIPFAPGSYRQMTGLERFAKKPIIIFSSQLRQDHAMQAKYLHYNPIAHLYRKYSEKGIRAAVPHDTHLTFLAEDEVRMFLVREFPAQPCAVIYGDFLGQELNIRATFIGIRRDQQILYENGEVELIPMMPMTLFLCSLPYSEFEPDVGNGNNDSLVYEILANIWLQMLVDSYYMFRPELPHRAESHKALLSCLGNFDNSNFQAYGQQLFELTARSDREVKEMRIQTALLRAKGY